MSGESGRMHPVGVLMCLFIGLLITPLSHAVLTDSLTLGNAKALALGHAVTADPPGIDSIHFNPAGLTRLKGRESELKLISGAFNIELQFDKGYTSTWTDKITEADGYAPPGFTYDESLGQTSQSEGAALMLPISGMTKLPVLFAPLGGVSYSPPGSKWTFGTNVYSPLMVGFSRAEDDPGRFMGEAISFTLITYFSPSLAYQVSDTLSIGGTITFNYAGVGLDLPFREPNLGLQWLRQLQNDSCLHEGEVNNFLAISDFIPCIPKEEAVKLYDTLGYLAFEVEKPLTFGTNVGFLWTPLPWLNFGAVYQSPIEMNMAGEFSWDQGKSLLNFFEKLNDGLPGGVDLRNMGALGSLVTPRTTGKAHVNMTMPDHFALGTSVQVLPRFKVNVDWKFTRWSEWKEIPVQFSEPIGVIVIANLIQPDAAPAPAGKAVSFPLGLKDTWNGAIGVEYQWNDRLALRMGYEDRPSSIPKEARSPLLPIGDAKLYSIGAEYTPNKNQTFSFAFATMQSETYMPGNTSRLGNAEAYNLFIYNPYSGNGITAKLDVLLLEASYRVMW